MIFDLTNLLSKILIVLLSVRFLLFNILYSVFNEHMVGSSGLEPPTSRLSGARSNHLSYEPM